MLDLLEQRKGELRGIEVILVEQSVPKDSFESIRTFELQELFYLEIPPCINHTGVEIGLGGNWESEIEFKDLSFGEPASGKHFSIDPELDEFVLLENQVQLLHYIKLNDSITKGIQLYFHLILERELIQLLQLLWNLVGLLANADLLVGLDKMLLQKVPQGEVVLDELLTPDKEPVQEHLNANEVLLDGACIEGP